MLTRTNKSSRHELQEKGFLMNDYEEIMNALVKLRDYCRGRKRCDGCKFEDFCSVNFGDNDTFPGNLDIEEEIICDG